MAKKMDRKITDLLKEDFTLSVEIVASKGGASSSQLISQIREAAFGGLNFVTVTSGVNGSPRSETTALSKMIQDEMGVPCVAHFTCQNLIPEELERELYAHHGYGLRNILALRGDPSWRAAGLVESRVRERSLEYAYQLVEQIVRLNRGQRLGRDTETSLKMPATNFCVGVACYPDEPDRQKRIDYLKRKVDAGAEYAVTQILLSPESYEIFRDECVRSGIQIPILPGICILKSQEQAQKLAQKFALKLNANSLRALPETDQAAAASPDRFLENFVKNVQELRRIGAPGVHSFLIGIENKFAAAALQKVQDV